ncbi:alpha/beta hydrolase family protein [Brevundimonas lutea]|uniref:alpha/beta hydrolase family protein n=1 Tax=Brevundimonas lutea TaxID=2293980 RepID=UPI000F033571|nr:alpha/beta fold hydrolase [Brevundimonas lutea]
MRPSHPRAKLNRLGAYLAVMVLAVSMLVDGPARSQPLTASEIAAPPMVTGAVVSPSGKYVAFLSWDGEENLIMVYDVETKVSTPIYRGRFREAFGGSWPEWVAWKTDDRILMGLSLFEVGRRRNDPDGRITTFRGGQGVISVRRDGTDRITVRAPRSRPGDPGMVLDTLPREPDEILMTFDDGGGVLSVARANVRTGESREVLQGERRVLSYHTDARGEVVARTRLRGLIGRILVAEGRDPVSGDWVELFRVRKDELRDFPDYDILGATSRQGELYVSARGEASDDPTAGVHIFDFRTRLLGPAIWRHAEYDVADVVLSEDGAFQAGCYWADAFECDFRDPEDAAVFRGLKRFFGGERSLSVASQSDDGRIWLLAVSGPRNPGDYFLYDSEARNVEPLGPMFRGLREERLAPTRRLDYAAGDGQRLHGYLTGHAPGPGQPPRPLIVLPHGGPEVRDTLSYDVFAQILATRGYQVLQPDFRGSSGRGRAWAEAGYREYGGVMQTDVYAGLDHMVAEGLADPARVCIMGASYGGYVAAWAAADQPDRFRCAVSIAGLSDLEEALRWERRQFGAGSDRYEYWVKSMGDPRLDEARLKAASPIHQVASWRTPVLLIHGEEDNIVSVEQSRALNRALVRAAKPVRYLEIEDAGHSGWSEEAWTLILAELDSFLGRHLPASPPTVIAQTP